MHITKENQGDEFDDAPMELWQERKNAKYNPEDEEEEDDYEREPIHKKGHSCRNLFGCLFLIIIIIGLMVWGTFKFVIGPAIQVVDKIPNDFPQEIVLYQANLAKIKVQTAESKTKVLNFLNSVPDWVSAPFLKWLSPDLKTQLVQKNFNQLSLPEEVTVDGLRNSLESYNAKDDKTVSLSWDNINKTKEEMATYYKQELEKNHFQIEEKLSDYNIDLGFWKDDVFGAIKIGDSFQNNGSVVDMTVNYSSTTNP
ncbi:MAG: hypothetical protein WC244_02980 [Patescibacteria group bacterium]|jgi:ABC-type Zn2+ transport system substrate-binding protein/surface adhesin